MTFFKGIGLLWVIRRNRDNSKAKGNSGIQHSIGRKHDEIPTQPFLMKNKRPLIEPTAVKPKRTTQEAEVDPNRGTSLEMVVGRGSSCIFQNRYDPVTVLCFLFDGIICSSVPFPV